MAAGINPRSRFRGLRLDPEIVDLIIELNKAGFEPATT